MCIVSGECLTCTLATPQKLTYITMISFEELSQIRADSRKYFVIRCTECRKQFLPSLGSRLWWRAKKRIESNELEMVSTHFGYRPEPMEVSGAVKCACKRRHQSHTPYRVVGFTMDCRDFDIPCKSFVEAVCRYYLEVRKGGTVFLKGVSSDQAEIEMKIKDLIFSS